MIPNPRLPRREVARKGFLEVKKPETSLKRKQLASWEEEKREYNRQMGKYKQRHSRTVLCCWSIKSVGRT